MITWDNSSLISSSDCDAVTIKRNKLAHKQTNDLDNSAVFEMNWVYCSFKIGSRWWRQHGGFIAPEDKQ